MASVAFHSSQFCIVLEVPYVLSQCCVQSLPASLVRIAICDVSYIVRSFTHTICTNIVCFIDVMPCSMVWRYQEPSSSCGWRWQFPPVLVPVYQIAWCHIPKDCGLNTWNSKRLKSYVNCISFHILLRWLHDGGSNGQDM